MQIFIEKYIVEDVLFNPFHVNLCFVTNLLHITNVLRRIIFKYINFTTIWYTRMWSIISNTYSSLNLQHLFHNPLQIFSVVENVRLWHFFVYTAAWKYPRWGEGQCERFQRRPYLNVEILRLWHPASNRSSI